MYDHSLCIALFLQFPETHSRLRFFVAVLMEPTSTELCELSMLGTLRTWVGVPEANALAIRKEWFSMFGANETGAASVIVRLPPD